MVTARESIESIAETYKLRYLVGSRRYLGVHDGICFDVSAQEGVLFLYAFAPAAQVGGQILEDFRGFATLAELDVPTSWVSGRMGRGNEADQHGCCLELTPGRLRELTPEQVLAIPQALANDLKAFGAQPVPGPCSFCEATDERLTLMILADEYRLTCYDCLDDLREQAPEGDLSPPQAVNWKHAAPTLLFGMVVLAVLWGLAQQPDHRLDSTVVLLAPFLGAVVMCQAAGSAAGGRSTGLRIATCAAVLVGVLAGNVWGFHALMRKQFPDIPLFESAKLYFLEWWPLNPGQESAYVIGGLAGAWFGWGMLKSTGLLKYE